MRSWHWRRAGAIVLAVCALGAVAIGTAWAGDDGSSEGAKPPQTATVIVTKNGTKTIKVITDKDGRFIVVPSEDDDAPQVQTRVMTGEGVTHTILGEVPDRARMRAALGGTQDAKSPMSSVMKWMMKRHGDYATGNDPVTAWFEGGPDVPLADLRNTLVADGWDATSLIEWLHTDLSGTLMALLGPALGGTPHAGHPMPSARPHPGMGGVMHAPGPGRGMRRGGGAGPGMRGPHARPGRGRWARARGPRSSARALMLWNDGHGWRSQELDAPHGWAPRPRNMGWGRRGMMRGHGRWGASEGCDCDCPDCPKRGRQGGRMRRGGRGAHQDLQGLPPEFRRLIEKSASGGQGAMIFPGGVRIEQDVSGLGRDLDGVREDLGIILDELGIMVPTAVVGMRGGGCGGDCGSCANKGSCKSKGAARKPGCCGQCDGDCENCPCRDGGKNCGADCGCKNSAKSKSCCGKCDGDCANCPCNQAEKPKECCGSCGGTGTAAPRAR